MKTPAFPGRAADRELIAAAEIAELVCCSTRTIARLHKSGAMPSPIHVGRLARWSRHEIERWIDAGCPVRGLGSTNTEGGAA